MADHDINIRNQQAFMVKEWIGISKFILERMIAIVPKMSSFYLGGAQDAYRIISVHVEKLLQSVMAGTTTFSRPADSVTSIEIDKMLEGFAKEIVPPPVTKKAPEKPAEEFYYETKDNIVFETNHKMQYVLHDDGESFHYDEVDRETKVYQSDKKDPWLHDRLMDHYKKYGPKSNPASIGRSAPDTVGLKAARQPDYYLDPHDLQGFWTMTEGQDFWSDGGGHYTIGDDFEGQYMFFDGILDPSFVGSTRWYAIPGMFNNWNTQTTTSTYKYWKVKDSDNNWYGCWKPVITNSSFWCPLTTVDDMQYGDADWGFRPGWIYSMGFRKNDSNTPVRQRAQYTRFNFTIKLDSVDPAVFKNVDLGMLLHESPVDPDVYVFGYSYYKSMVRTLIYNQKGLKVSCNWLGGKNDTSGDAWRDEGVDRHSGYFSDNLRWNKTLNPINIVDNSYRFLAPGKWLSGVDSFSFQIPAPATSTAQDVGYEYLSGNNKGSPNFLKYRGPGKGYGFNDMDYTFVQIKTNVDIWKTFKGQCELNRYYYPLSQIYENVDSSYQNRFIKVFGSADYNMVDLYKNIGKAYDHGPYKVKTHLDDKYIIPLYIEVCSTEVDESGVTKDKEVNVHFTGGQETWFSPYFNWTNSTAFFIKQILELFLDKLNTTGTTDMDAFNMYQKANEYVSFFKSYTDTVVQILSVPPLGGTGMSAGASNGITGNPSPAPMAKRKYKIKNKKGKTLYEFFEPKVRES